MLELKNVTGLGKGFLLHNISFCAEEGYLYTIAGKNGAGKTTLFKYLMCEKEYEGSIELNGLDITKHREEYLNKTAFISDDVAMFMELSAEANVELYSGFYSNWDNEIFKSCMKEFNVSTGLILQHMSRGEYIKFQLAFGLAHNAEVFYFDEATAGMDTVFRKDFFKIVRKMLADEKLVIMTTHIREEIERISDFTGIMEEGRFGGFMPATPLI